MTLSIIRYGLLKNYEFVWLQTASIFQIARHGLIRFIINRAFLGTKKLAQVKPSSRILGDYSSGYKFLKLMMGVKNPGVVYVARLYGHGRKLSISSGHKAIRGAGL